MAKSAGQQLLETIDPQAAASAATDPAQQPATQQSPVETNQADATGTNDDQVADEQATSADQAAGGQIQAGPPDFLEAMRTAGFADISDENSARQRLLDAYREQQQRLADIQRRVTEIEPLAQYGSEYLQTLRRGQSPQSQQVQQAQPESQERKSWWNPPKVDPALVQKYYKLNATSGEYEWSRDTPAPIRAAAEEYQAYNEQWQHNLLHNPPAALEAPIRQVVEEILSQAFGGIPLERLPETLDVTGERRLLEQFEAQYGELVYPRSPITNQLNRDELTPFGKSIQTNLEKAAAIGIASSKDRLDYALAMANLEHPQATQQSKREAQATATTTKREEHRQVIRRRAAATGITQRNGSDGDDTRSQNRNLSAGQQLVASLNGA